MNVTQIYTLLYYIRQVMFRNWVVRRVVLSVKRLPSPKNRSCERRLTSHALCQKRIHPISPLLSTKQDWFPPFKLTQIYPFDQLHRYLGIDIGNNIDCFWKPKPLLFVLSNQLESWTGKQKIYNNLRWLIWNDLHIFAYFLT